jgi:hypothetical protein
VYHLPHVDEHRCATNNNKISNTRSWQNNYNEVDIGTQLSMNINPNVPDLSVSGYNTHHTSIPQPPPPASNAGMGMTVHSAATGHRKIQSVVVG